MRKNIVKNLLLTLVLALFAAVINATGVEAAKEKAEFVYSQTVGNIVVEVDSPTFKGIEGSSTGKYETDIRIISTDDAELITGVIVEAISDTSKPEMSAVIENPTDEVIFEGYDIRTFKNRENGFLVYIQTTVEEYESPIVISLMMDSFAPEFVREEVLNTTAGQKIEANLEILEVNGLKNIEYLAIPTGEPVLGKDWVEYAKYGYEATFDEFVKNISIEGLTDGSYDLYVRLTDYAGNVSEEKLLGTYKVDNTAPNFTTDFVVPEDWTKEGQITLPLSPEGLLTYQINDGEINVYDETNNVITVDTQGENKIVITATDAAGNVATKEVTLKLDTEAPVVTIDVTEASLDLGTKTSVTLTAADANSGDCVIYYSIDGAEFETYENAIELDIKIGSYEIVYYAVDAAGNESEKETYTTTAIDNLDTVITVEKDLGVEDALFTSEDVTVNVKVESAVGIATVTYHNEETPDTKVDLALDDIKFVVSENGTYVLEITTVLGEVITENVVVGEIDNVAPVIDNFEVITTRNELEFVVDYSDDYSGTFALFIMICNEGDADCRYDLDTEPNFVKLIVVVEDPSTIDLQGIIKVDLVSVVSKEEFVNYVETIDVDGTYVVKALTYDNAFNSSTVSECTVEVDGTAPEVATITRDNQEDISVNDYVFTVTQNGSDALSGVKEEYITIYKYDETGNKVEVETITDFTNGFTISEEGKYEVFYYISDVAGNENTYTDVVIIDRTAPEFEVTFNVAEKTWTNKLEMDVKVTNDLDAETVETIEYGYALEGETITDMKTLEDFQKVELPLETGRYVFKVVVTDKLGNKSEFESGVYYVDLVKPVITIKTELENKILTEAGEVVVELNDADSGLDVVSYTILKNGEPLASSTTIEATAGLNIPLANAEEGKYAIVVVLKDKAGNVVEVESDEFTVDLFAPVVTGLNETRYHSTEITLTVSDMTNVEGTLNGVAIEGNTIEVKEDGYYQLVLVDEAGRETHELFVVNAANQLELKNQSVDTLTQRYLPVVEEDGKYYVYVPASEYGLKNVLVFTTEKDGVQTRLAQEENYIYLKKNVNSSVEKNGYKLEIRDKDLTDLVDIYGNYGYVVVSAITTDEALSLDIEVVVIDNEGLALGLGIAGSAALIGLFFLSRGKKTLKV